MEDIKIWLENNCEPWGEIKEKWVKSSAYRTNLNKQKNSNDLSAILKEWPRYNDSFGYHLVSHNNSVMHPINLHSYSNEAGSMIEIDFEHLYSGKNNLLLLNFTEFVNKASILFDRFKDNLNSDLYINFLQPDINPDSKACIAILLLHSLLPPPRLNRKFKPTVSDSQEDFVLHVATMNDIHKKISECQADCLQKGMKMQPRILVVGQNMKDLSAFYVFCDGIKYKLPTFTKALDICIKLMYVFNVQYPTISKLVWIFIQEYIYHIPSEIIYPAIRNFIKQLEALDIILPQTC